MNVAIVSASDTGQRMRNTAHPKQSSELYGKSIIIYTLEISQSHPGIDAIIVPYVDEWHDHLRGMARKFGTTGLLETIPGGKTSQEFKLSALRALKDICSGHDIILIHSTAHPLITLQIISDNITSVKAFDSATTVDPFTGTGIISGDGKIVEVTIKRQRLYIAKAP